MYIVQVYQKNLVKQLVLYTETILLVMEQNMVYIIVDISITFMAVLIERMLASSVSQVCYNMFYFEVYIIFMYTAILFR